MSKRFTHKEENGLFIVTDNNTGDTFIFGNDVIGRAFLDKTIENLNKEEVPHA